MGKGESEVWWRLLGSAAYYTFVSVFVAWISDLEPGKIYRNDENKSKALFEERTEKPVMPVSEY